jgi:hypothetical protein
LQKFKVHFGIWPRKLALLEIHIPFLVTILCAVGTSVADAANDGKIKIILIGDSTMVAARRSQTPTIGSCGMQLISGWF